MAEERNALAEQIVDAMNAVYGAHPRRRAAHAKGFFCAGTFKASPEARELSRAPHLQGDVLPATIRFSVGSGDPDAHDAERESRGIAVKIELADGETTDILGVTVPAFVARNPEEFLEMLRARRPNPETGTPDMEAIGAFLSAHPESMPAVQGTIGVPPPASYARLAYNAFHAFRLVDSDGRGTWVRYRLEPEAGEERLEDDVARAKGPDYLREELEECLASGPAGFELRLILAEDGDPLDDPTALWPEDRKTVGGGRLEVERIIEDPEEDGGPLVFDPTRVPDGVEPSDDPILHMRPLAYSVSVERRS